LCQATLDDMIMLGGTGARILLGKNGEVIYPSDFQSVKDLGYGLLKLKTQGRYLLLHKSGQMLTSKLFEDIGLLHGTLVKVKSRTKWGIITVTDHEILPADYDDIYELGPFIVVERGETLAVTNTQTLLTNLGQNQPLLNFIFEELESIDDQYMLALEGNREAIINLDLEEMIPLKEQQIIDLRNHWVVQSDLKFFLLNKQFELLEDEIDWIQYDNSWLALKKKDKWTLMYQDNSFNPSYRFDSLKLISEEYIYLSTKDSSYVSFANRNTLKLSGSENIRLIKTREANSLSDYLLTINKNGTKRLYNHLGKKVLAGKFEQVTPINDQVFIIEEKSKKGLSNSIGRNVLPIKYDAIGEYFGGNVSILRGGKFGIYNHIKRLTIEPSYDRPLKPYDKQLLTASKKGKLGVIDLKNKVVLPFVYQQIIHWNDSLALVQQSGEWGLISIDDETVYHNIIKYKMVINNKDEKIMIYETEKGVGLISSSKGIIIAPTYNDISVLQTPSDPIFLAEKFIPEAEFYIAIYYDVKGEIIRKQAFTAAEYAKVSCK
ncbi:MAG: WG repeat-containing protein, partial [Bacteroidetes bacterium]|nr:WG repeat-containing protein [Bacteroidota bacterium]